MAKSIAARIVIAAAFAVAMPSPVAAQSDSTPPSVSITSPAAGDRVSRNVTIAAAVSDAGKVTSVTFRVDGAVVGADTKAPYSVRWNTRDAADGSHTLSAEARDAAGNVGTSAPITVIVGEAPASPPADTTAPTVSITAPAGGAQITGTIAVSASASDAVGVTSVSFFVDGAAIGTDTSSPYGVNWDSSTVAAGSHTFRAEARDAAGNVGSSAPVSASVGPSPDRTAPTLSITSPAAGAQVSGTVAIAASATDGVGIASVTFFVDGAAIGTDTSSPYSVNWNTSSVAAGAHTLRAEARDAAGNVGTSASISVTVAPPPDATAPVVSVTSPAGGTQVTGTVAITASATDAVGVASVTFFVDGAAIGTDTAAPYSANWNTSGVAAGSHALRAEARDAAGNIGVSATITVTIAAANQPPSVTMTATAPSYVAPAAMTLTATATDSDGTVSRVDFYEGTTLIGSDSSNPFTLAWTASSARAYLFSAVAVDNQSAATTSGAVSITVTAPTRPSTAVFEPSADNANVTQYVLDIFVAGSNPATATPVRTQDLGKPPIVAGEMSADIRTTTALLSAGSYVATVTAVTPTQRARSAASPTFSIVSTTASMVSSTAWLASPTGPTFDSPLATRSDGVLWVTNATAGLVTAFNATTGDVLATIPVGLKPAGIAGPDGTGKVYVADEGSDTVSVISRATMSVVRTITLPAPYGRQPHHVSDSPDGRFVYVGESGSNVVDVIDTASDEIVGRYAAGWPGSKTRAVVSDPEGAVLYAVSRGAAPSPSTLVALDAGTGQWLWQLALAGEPADFLVSADGRFGMVVRQADGRIDVVDLEQHAVARVIDLGTGDINATLQLAPDGRVAIVAPGAAATQAKLVDVVRMAAIPSVSLGAAAAGTTLPARQLSYVTVPGNSEVPTGIIAIDTNTRTVTRRFALPGGGSPQGAVLTFD